MKRNIFKIGALSLGAGGLVLLAIWFFSFTSDATRPQYVFGNAPTAVHVSVAKGKLIFSDHFSNRAFLIQDQKLDTLGLIPPVISEVHKSLMGYNYHRAAFKGGRSIWTLDVSLLIPCLIATSIAGAMIWRLRVLRRNEGLDYVVSESESQKVIAQQVGGDEPPPRFSVQRWAAV